MSTTTATTTTLFRDALPQTLAGYVSRDVSPNRGTAVGDLLAGGENSLSQEDFYKRYEIDNSSRIQLTKIAFMRYQVPDLNQITTFLKDFGLFKVKKTETEAWFRGYGEDQYVYYVRKGPKKFLGGAFTVDGYEELVRASKIPGVKVLSDGMEELKDAPGGGYILTLEDPEGFPISLVTGIAPSQPLDTPEKIVMNDETDKPRVRKFQRFTAGPCAVHKLGHYGLVVKDFQAQFDFYIKNFNLTPTNILYLEDEQTGKKTNVGMFAHVDRGDSLVDHHTLFLVTLPPGHEKPHPHHCSFEVHDVDSQAIGHYWLAGKGYESVWGVGRHILGSQIFDYWWDPTGNMVEHYIDGDVVNRNTPVGFDLASSAKDVAWGPDVPAEFLE